MQRLVDVGVNPTLSAATNLVGPIQPETRKVDAQDASGALKWRPRCDER